MGLSQNISAYEDLRHILDRALSSDNGIEVEYSSHGQAVHNRHRLYKFRSLLRQASVDIYEPGDPARGTSEYDYLTFTTGDKGTFDENKLYIKKGSPIQIREL